MVRFVVTPQKPIYLAAFQVVSQIIAIYEKHVGRYHILYQKKVYLLCNVHNGR